MNLTGIGIAAALAVTCFANTAHADDGATVPAPAATAPVTTTTAPLATSAEPPAATSHRTAWPWILMGTGVALVVTAAAFEVHAVSQDDKREDDETKLFSIPEGDPSRAPLQASRDSHDDSAKSARTTALIVGTVGFLAVAGSVVLWFVEGSSGDGAASSAAKAKTPSLLPSFGPGYAGATLGATF